MRINKFLADATGISRRAADIAINNGRVKVNGVRSTIGRDVQPEDSITLDGAVVRSDNKKTTILLNKPIGYVCSRKGQGSKTVYDLLPEKYHSLKPVGRLDKDSSGLLLLTNDGELANNLTHPSRQKIKQYEVELNKPLEPLHHQMISDYGIQLEDGRSKLELTSLKPNKKYWQVRMSEGRNRQIRRTFAALGYTVTKLHRTNFGEYELKNRLSSGGFEILENT